VPEYESTRLEQLIRHDRVLIVGGLVLVTALCWAWIAPMAVDMYGAMTGPSAWMMTTNWDAAHILLLWAMWAVMMAGMMLPSASPMLLIYAQAVRRKSDAPGLVSRVYAMAAGYLIVWAAFSVAATGLQRLLSEWLLLTPMMEMVRPAAIASVLALAGLYQLTPIKRICLRWCRSPLAFVMQRWRNGTAGALRMGIEHGVYCLGCCWALMLLLFAGGVMNIYVIVALTLLVLIEKVAAFGEWSSRVSGVALLALAAWTMVRQP
jgi:predicted metal-binding membrane protein